MLCFDFEKNCYGCGVCEYVCPEQAITLSQNSEGFMMPVIEQDKCIRCGLCLKKCIYLNPTKPQKELASSDCYAAFRCDEQKRISSASGGIAAVITERFLDEGGIVIGCAYTDDLSVEHIAIVSTKDSFRLQSSKYVQSDIRKMYSVIKETLNKKRRVLFFGTPCQTAAIRNVFGNDKNLFIVGLICGGVPSPKVWKKFKADKEKQYKSKMVKANFRHKGRYGWNTPEARYEFANHKSSEKLSFQSDDYVVQYLYGYFKRHSCFHCQYKGDGINADMMLGDFWGSGQFRTISNNKGVSAVLCLTDKGKELLDLCSDECEIKETTLESILFKNKPLIDSVNSTGKRKEFFQELDKTGYMSAVKKYGVKLPLLKRSGIAVLDKLRLLELTKRLIDKS